MLLFVCVLRSGGSYSASHVLTLAESIRRFNPGARILCFTDVVIPDSSIEIMPLQYGLQGWFSKLEVFSLVDQPFIYIDLDVVITGPIEVELNEGLYLLRGFGVGAVNSSVMYVNGNFRSILEGFLLDVSGNIKAYSVPERWGDQDFIRDSGLVSGFLQDVAPGLAASWKRDLGYQMGRIPRPPRILVFHGAPKPEELWIRFLSDGSLFIFGLRYFLKYIFRRFLRVA